MLETVDGIVTTCYLDALESPYQVVLADFVLSQSSVVHGRGSVVEMMIQSCMHSHFVTYD